jgi:hypothetical protein
MSHFTVLVIGDDVETALQPFHEFECTGYVDQYVVDVDTTEEMRKEYVEEFNKSAEHQLKYGTLRKFFKEWAEYDCVTSRHEIDLENTHKFGYVMLNMEENDVIKAIRRTNPNRQWDWWVEGGRWSDMLLLKNGTRADSALIQDIDFARMRAEAIAEAKEEWDNIQAVLQKYPNLKSWDEIRTTYTDIDVARTEYRAQDGLTEFQAIAGFMNDRRAYDMSEEMYLQRAADRSFQTFAVLKDDQWFERGRMGWFGSVSDQKDHDTWNQEFTKLIESLDPKTRVTVVDCHI